MNLLVLMYHRARAERHGNPPEMLDAHFAAIAANHHHVLPGERLSQRVLNVCLTFDDGYFDFYAFVFPLLKKHRLRALLAIPPFFIPEQTALAPHARLAIDSATAFARPASAGFCTWTELAEMAESGHVAIAAHGFTHRPLDHWHNLRAEIDLPHTILSSRLGRPVDSFVFPFGRSSRQSRRHARQCYRHVFRIGGAINRSWHGGILYRVDADRMNHPQELFSPKRLLAYRVRRLWNRLRLR